MNHDFVLAIVTAVVTGPGGWGILQFILSRKQKAADAVREREDREVEAKRDQQAADSQTWYRESKHNYQIAKREAAEAKRECADCRKELNTTRQVIYRMLEDIDEQIITMLQFPDSDLNTIRLALRQVVNTAREAL